MKRGPIPETFLSDVVSDTAGNAFFESLTEVDEQIVAIQALRKEIFTDHLTGLPNYKAMLGTAREMIDQSEKDRVPVLVVVGDLDGFKQINDTLGHDGGDMVLRGVSRSIRDTDKYGILGRKSGDEFMLLFRLQHNPKRGDTATKPTPLAEEEIPAAVDAIMNRVRGSVSNYSQTSRIRVGISLGGAVHMPGDKRPVDELLIAADAGMYADKTRQLSKLNEGEREIFERILADLRVIGISPRNLEKYTTYYADLEAKEKHERKAS
jgi:diguanylate cyclase (GGDEF)-like protein